MRAIVVVCGLCCTTVSLGCTDSRVSGRDSGAGLDAAAPDSASPDRDAGPVERDAGPPPAPACVEVCSTADDCALGAAGGINDVNNYACEGSRCRWLGCLDDAECQSSLGPGTGGTWVCDRTLSTPGCVEVCSTADDCALGAAGGTNDVNNYACEGSRCRWLGCLDDAECQSSLGPGTGGTWVCSDS